MTPPRRSSGGGGHCELTPTGTCGRREMNTFGDTSSQVHFCSETRRHSRPHTSSAVADGQVLDTAARACLYRTRHRKPRRRGPGQRRYPRTGAPRPRCCGGRGPETPMRLTGRRPASHTAAPVLLLLSAYYIGAAAAAAATAAVARRARSPAAKFPNVSTNTSGSARASARGSGTREAPRPPSARASASQGVALVMLLYTVAFE